MWKFFLFYFIADFTDKQAMKSNIKKVERSVAFQQSVLEQVKGVEPSYRPWEGRVLPMNYTCLLT